MRVLFQIIGHIDERKRPEGFPKEAIYRYLAEGIHKDEIHIKSNVLFANIIAAGYIAMQKEKDLYKLEMGNPSYMAGFDQVIAVPMHMITHIETVTQVLPEVPEGSLPV